MNIVNIILGVVIGCLFTMFLTLIVATLLLERKTKPIHKHISQIENRRGVIK